MYHTKLEFVRTHRVHRFVPSDGMGTRLGTRQAVRWAGAPRRRYSTRAASELRVCVVGSGPAGFYTAHQLVKVRTAGEVRPLCHVTKSGRALPAAPPRRAGGRIGAAARAVRAGPLRCGT